MFLPIGDSPNPRGKPWVTWTLIAINIAVFVALFPISRRPADPYDPATRAYVRVLAAERNVDARGALSGYDVFLFRHGFKPAAPRITDLLASLFLHGGLMHLAGNMLFLWIYGDNVEDRLGRGTYLLLYLGTGIAASLADALLRFGSAIPAVGASGAISGVLGMYFLWFPRNTVRVWIFFFPFFANVVELPARLVLGIFVVLDNLLPLLFAGAGGGVAFGAHLGGFAAGLGVAAAWNRLRLLRPEKELRAAGRRTRPPAPPAPETASRLLREALDGGRLPEALELLLAAPRRGPGAFSARDELLVAEALERAGHPQAALSLYQRSLQRPGPSPSRAAAHLGAARVLFERMGMPAAAYPHLLAAAEAGPSPEQRAEARRLLAALRGATSSIPRRLDGELN